MGGIAIGMLLYNQLISRYTVKYIARALKKVIRFVEKVWRFILTPFRKAAKKASDKSAVLVYKGRKFKKYLNKQLKRTRKLIRIGISKK